MAGETFLNGRVTLYCGDSREVLKSLPDCSLDSIVCDPPYALVSIGKRFGRSNMEQNAEAQPPNRGAQYKRLSRGFMGKQWDTGETAFAAEFWALVFDKLKPGGHVVAFSGTRTYHRMVVAVEDAGFEIRDQLLDIVASDTAVGQFMASLNDAQRSAFLRCIEESQFGGQLGWLYGSGFPKSHDVSKGIDKAAGATRKVVGKRVAQDIRGGNLMAASQGKGSTQFEVDVTEPATPEAAKWAGYGTALKPAWEPIVLARKPLDGTVVQNVLTYGTGAINIDGCRIEGDGSMTFDRAAGDRPRDQYRTGTSVPGSQRPTDIGRWPANVIHDGSAEVLATFPDAGAASPVRGSEPSPASAGHITGERQRVPGAFHADSGNASRFFYTAKADADDRLGSKHPTVKPVDLMRWLVRLVTPPGGTVLDPFAGTGSTGEAAFLEGCNVILIERESEYQEDIRRRMALVLSDTKSRKRAHNTRRAEGQPKPAANGFLAHLENEED